ncbi:AAA family ATPase [Nonomuraea fuscirosea]|uniref:ATP-binding protein n=1 Tax=Nonomuraea fuscirosea TaxID=1291556 RepID=UPI002DDC7AEF|nr:AAA family ATPase [Nonomuraea fuscirosea]WSA48354.1 AAA family ATPase [Nonomuraea fuscirosea]
MVDGLLRLEILGPLRIWRDGVELDPGPGQQAFLLALLLARVGRPVSTSELIDLIWGDEAPASALNVIHKYVGALRRLLEPGLPARAEGSFLHRRGDSYLITANAETLDLVAFRDLVSRAKSEHDERALDLLTEALGRWHGPAGSAFAHWTAAEPAFAALDAEFFAVCVTATTLAMTLGQPAKVLPPLQLAASMAPLNEPVQASLVSALSAAGNQAEALAVVAAVRARLADDLGVDPGPAMRAAHHQALTRNAMPVTTTCGAEAWASTSGGLVGRAKELGALTLAVRRADTGGSGIGVVEGEPGAGKTRLLQEVTAEAEGRGALAVWGRCFDGDGTPSLWPWTQAIGAVVESLPAAVRQRLTAGELGRLVGPHDAPAAAPVLPNAGLQFRLFEQVVTVIGEAAARRPLLLVLDDLQWADAASLRLFTHVAARLPARTVILGAARDRAPVTGTELSRALAAAGRVPGHWRIRLGLLDPIEAAELVRHETGQNPAPAVVRGIHARAAGNPFYIRELSRMLAGGGALTGGLTGGFTDGAAAHPAVPETVNDVVLDRMSGLGTDARDLLRTAALIGRNVDLDLLTRAAGLDVQGCLELLAPVEALGMIESAPDDPFSVSFAHDLVRESVAGKTPPAQTGRLHLRIAEALEGTGPVGELDAERLAFHLWEAGPLADPARTARALVRAGARAAFKSAFEAAERHLLSAVRVARAAGLADLELSALSSVATVFWRQSMFQDPFHPMMERAENLARGLGREGDAADFLFMRMVEAYSAVRPDRAELARRLHEQGTASLDPIVKAYGSQARGQHQWEAGDIGEAVRQLNDGNRIMWSVPVTGDSPLRTDLRPFGPLLAAVVATISDDLGAAHALLDGVRAAAGDDPYSIAVWAHFAGMAAAMAGDPGWALAAAQPWIAADPEHLHSNIDPYLRITTCWARALTGDDPAGAAAEADRILTTTLADPPRFGLAFHVGLIADMLLSARMPDEAAAALDRADRYLADHGQRYAEGLLLLLRARQLWAHGEPAPVVREIGARAVALSGERGAHLFARRAGKFLAEIAHTTNPLKRKSPHVGC